jgi:hypothetical protein
LADKRPLPDWYVPEDAAPKQAADNRPLPDWYTPEPRANPFDQFDTLAATAPSANPFDQFDPPEGSATMNFASHVAQAPGAIVGAPRAVLNDLPNWVIAQRAICSRAPI